MRSIHFALMGAAATLAAACASQPEPEPTPAPAAPLTEARPAPVTPPPAPQPTGPAAGSRADFLAKATDRVYFGYDQHVLDDADRAALQGQAAWMKQFPAAKVQIAGNADERGTREYNLALGARRAESAASYLVSLGVDASRVTTISYGKDRPMNPGNNEAAWSQNRNAQTVVVTEAVS